MPEISARQDTRPHPDDLTLRDLMLAARAAAGLTQALIAAHMGTTEASIARLECELASGGRSPSIDTLRKYAAACGKKLVISFA
ncbi:transcriptional regulator with XRE-family HTH domain [Paraburkholderia sp. HC6.4b]|uniref:helix-turn-helix domain-containing protein n=1 Tax=unclassified Paraburkholderia TaxID=2615204 RepID=UPI001621730F|nr:MULTISPECIES: helix-turn-helix transcriptional regulator [unclassified Paraburkholderia]MBB5411882.1 transcriptional regulator with XRE-family HTH domain [Paraburkholderia sp. HC6.4b]MBB5450194.1 transcriptional regulator with XRE-family HTH domain [Paraburkholderia sp. Kb1A]